MGGMVSQNVMNLVDTAMVGSLGQAALAAVGLSSLAVFCAQAFLMGLSSGVQAIAARRMGEGEHDNMAAPLNGGLLFSLLLGIPLTVILFDAAPSLYGYLNDDPDVVRQGVPYLQARLLAIVTVGMNFSFRGYFNGVNRSAVYLTSLLAMHACNLCLNYLLIFGAFGFPEMGATGAGVGTAVSTLVGTVVYFVMGMRHARSAGFLRGLPSRDTITAMLRLSLPSSVRQLLFAAGLTVLFRIVGMVGTTELAAAQVLINLMLVAILPAIGLGMAAASLVGQALGRGEPEDAKRWGWDVVKVALTILSVLALPMLLIPNALLWPFLRNAPEAIIVAEWPLRVISFVILADAVGLVLQNALLGAGDSMRVAVFAIVLQWALFLPTAYLVGPVLKYGLLGIWLAMAAQRLLQAVGFGLMWQRGRWMSLRV